VILSVWLSVMVLIVAMASPAYAQEADREAALKAAFIYNFAKFTEWPAERLRGPTDPIVFCVAPSSPMREAITLLQDKPVGTRPVRVATVTDDAGAAACHVLFIDASASPRLRQLAQTNLNGVLTVSDLPNFATLGGNIGFFFASNQLRFQINLDAARRSGIGFSSKLLRLADVIGQHSNRKRTRLAAIRRLVRRL
jgi:hypothetical protein